MELVPVPPILRAFLRSEQFWTSVIRGGLARGLSMTATELYGRAAGGIIGHERYRGLWAEVSGLRRYQAVIEALRPETVVPKRWVQEGWDWQKYPFIYETDITIYNPTTGERETFQRFLGSPDLISSGEAHVRIAQWYVQSPPQEGWEVETIQLYGVRHRPGEEWRVRGQV